MVHKKQKHTLTPTQHLIADLDKAKAGAEEGTLDHLWPAKMYNQKVTVTAPDGRETMVMPKFCLTEFATTQLIAALATRGLNCRSMVGGGTPSPGNLQIAGSFHYSEQVPWLTVALGAELEYTFNAGEVYDYFTHGRTPKDALNLAEWDIRQQAFLENLGPAPDPAVIMAQTTS
jgi:hypothetical protein